MVRLYAVDRLPTIEMMVFFVKYELDSRAMLPRFTLLKKKEDEEERRRREEKSKWFQPTDGVNAAEQFWRERKSAHEGEKVSAEARQALLCVALLERVFFRRP